MKMVETLPRECLVVWLFVELGVDVVGDHHRDLAAPKERAKHPVTVRAHSCNSAMTVFIPLSFIA